LPLMATGAAASHISSGCGQARTEKKTADGRGSFFYAFEHDYLDEPLIPHSPGNPLISLS
jgi:hypothetical protein